MIILPCLVTFLNFPRDKTSISRFVLFRGRCSQITHKYRWILMLKNAPEPSHPKAKPKLEEVGIVNNELLISWLFLN